MHLKDLKEALENKEFVYYYQPKVSMITGKLCGAEALLRWQKPDGRIIPPSEFIPLAESSGFINEITLVMFQQLIIDMSIIHDVVDTLVISFNASAKDFRNNRLTEAIRHAITNKLLTSDTLEVELTETAILDSDEEVKHQINLLHEMGIGLAMDDFGTGYSSIDTLSKWPFSSIKIDQGVIGRMGHSEKDFIIVQSSISMAHELGLDIVAEGIETEDCYQHLLGSGCTKGQGYWISRPVPLDEFIDFTKLGKNWSGELIGLAYQAQLDHIKWRKALIDGLYYISSRKGGNTQLRGTPELDPRKCSLGKWFYSLGETFTKEEWYGQLEESHTLLHHTGANLLESAGRGRPKKELIQQMRKLTEQSIRVIGILQEIENRSVENSRTTDPE